jgi:hypothetical protein
MFENTKEPKDMFEGVETGTPRPTMPAMVPPAMPMPDLESVAPPKRGIPWKPIVFVIAILLVIAAAGTISYYILASRTSPTSGIPAAQEPTDTTTQTPTPEPTPTPSPVITPPIVETPTDTDHDGLSDAQETQLGTSITSSDTDADGLFDREEVEVYKTNPLNPDTDGDGYLDGAEVKSGYNPNGPGKLFDVPPTSGS